MNLASVYDEDFIFVVEDCKHFDDKYTDHTEYIDIDINSK